MLPSCFWQIFGIATALKALLIPAKFSTDFEVHRNWLAITYSLPLRRWYFDTTSPWTLDYPPCFAYFEWVLAQIAHYIDPRMLDVENLNYASIQTVYFQRASVIVVDIVYAYGVMRCLSALSISKKTYQHFVAELFLLLNVGLLFVDHIHFQYNGLLFGMLLLSISYLLEAKYLKCAFTFALLLNFKHIFLYMAPAFAIYLFRFYCLSSPRQGISAMMKLLAVGLAPFAVSFGPFLNELPQLLKRLFPFKRGLTHAYWAPNFWALYNTADKGLTYILRQQLPAATGATTTFGLVQDFQHVVLPTVTPLATFVLTALFMLPILVKLLFYTNKSEAKYVFLRAVILCTASSFMFGWHVHEKAILMCLIPLCLLALVQRTDAKYAFMLSVVGYFSLFPLLFHIDLLVVRYTLYLAYICNMYAQLLRLHSNLMPMFNLAERGYLYGFVLLPIYEHIVSPLTVLGTKLPFMPLLLTSLYASIGVTYFFITYYLFTLQIDLRHVCCFVGERRQHTPTRLPESNKTIAEKPKAKTKQKAQ